jgi:hypothetical protein
VADPTLFHFTVDPVASFRSLELDLIKIRAAEALTPPIKSSNRSRLPPPPSPRLWRRSRLLSAKTAIPPARDIQPSIALEEGPVYIRAQDLARTNRAR